MAWDTCETTVTGKSNSIQDVFSTQCKKAAKNPWALGISEQTSTHCTHTITTSSKSPPLKLAPFLKYVYITLQSCVHMSKNDYSQIHFSYHYQLFFFPLFFPPVCVAGKKINLNQFNYFLLCGITCK